MVIQGRAGVPDATQGRSAYDDLPDGVVVTDGTGVVVSANGAAGRILDAAPVDLIGMTLSQALPLVDPQGRDWWECTNPFGGLTTRVRQPERLLTVSRRSGADRTVLVTASYLRDPSHRVTSVVVCLRDTVARTRHERSGAELVSVVAHELRSPLTSVKGFTATLLAKWERFNDEQKLHMLRTVNSDADRLTRLISELLDVSRIETGRLELRKQVVDLPALVERDVAARIAAGETAERFVIAPVEGTLPELWADPDKLAQVVGNIVENALRHGAGTVSISVATVDGGVTAEVVDQGDGITREALPRIFTKFWHDARRGGTGLGLFIAKGIVDAHGGTITAGNSAAGGAAVRFTLPAGTPTFVAE
jgi:PAS domain S-box-containing protein